MGFTPPSCASRRRTRAPQPGDSPRHSRECREAVIVRRGARLADRSVKPGVSPGVRKIVKHDVNNKWAPSSAGPRLVELCDRALPAVQEPVLTPDPGVVFCAAVDRKAFLPTDRRVVLTGLDGVTRPALAVRQGK